MPQNLSRRSFLKTTAVILGASTLPRTLISATSPNAGTSTAKTLTADLFIYGSTPAGIAAATEAAKLGLTVILACPKKHIGGMLASGLGNLDTSRGDLLGGFVNTYRQAVRDEYNKLRAAGAPEWQLRTKGGAEPSVVERAFESIIAPYSKITRLLNHTLTGASTNGARITSVTLAPYGQFLAGNSTDTHRIIARTYIDATYEGDLADAAKVPHRIAREAADEFNESLAGIRYMNTSTGEFYKTPDTGASSPAIQAYCARSVFTTDPKKLIPFKKPDTYEQHLPDLYPLLTDFKSGRLKSRSLGAQLPSLKFELNGSINQQTSLNCPGMSWHWPAANPQRRAELEKFHVDHAASFTYFLATHPQIPDNVRNLWKKAGLHRDEFPDNNHWPWQIYVRQGRRIEGRAKVTQHNFIPDKKSGRTPIVQHPIAIGDFSFDVHPCHDRRTAINDSLEGVISFPRHARINALGQVPYAALLPKTLDNLLVPVCLSATHIGMSVLRMEPVWMTTAHIAALAAYTAQKNSLQVSQIDPANLATAARINTDPFNPKFPPYKFTD